MAHMSFFYPGRFALFTIFILCVNAQFGLPPCSASCARDAAAQAGCGIADVACLCKNQLVLLNGVQCAATRCPKEEYGPASQIILKLCPSLPLSGGLPTIVNPPPKPNPTTQPKPPNQAPPPPVQSTQQQPAATHPNTKPANPTNTHPSSSIRSATAVSQMTSVSSAAPDTLAVLASTTTANASGSTLSVSSTINSTSLDSSTATTGPSVAAPESSTASANTARGVYQYQSGIGAAAGLVLVALGTLL